MNHDPSKLTFAFLGKPTVEVDGTHVSIRAYYNEGIPGMEESKEIRLTLGTDDPAEVVVAAVANAHAWAETLGGNISTRELEVGPINKSRPANAQAAVAVVSAANEYIAEPVDEDDI